MTRWIALAVLLCAPACAVPRPTPSAPNPVVAYLEDAELQAEGEAQLENIRAALRDWATLSATKLRARRYSDFQGRPAQWDLRELVQHHFVPSTPRGLHDFWGAAARMAQELDRWNTRPR
jgi:hypothetical protein